MFTGLITDIGQVAALERQGDWRLTVTTRWDMSAVPIGASIACNGVCLTVVERGNRSFTVQVSAETLSRTDIGGWDVGTRINLERSLRLGDELGGHLVYGHVDGLGRLVSRTPDADSQRLVFSVPDGLARFVAEKGSIAVNGVSLTVNAVGADSFDVNIIPHTQVETTLGSLPEGSAVNLEVDMLARYVARLQEVRA